MPSLSGAGVELLLYSRLASYGILNPIAAAYVLTYADAQKLIFRRLTGFKIASRFWRISQKWDCGPE